MSMAPTGLARAHSAATNLGAGGRAPSAVLAAQVAAGMERRGAARGRGGRAVLVEEGREEVLAEDGQSIL